MAKKLGRPKKDPPRKQSTIVVDNPNDISPNDDLDDIDELSSILPQRTTNAISSGIDRTLELVQSSTLTRLQLRAIRLLVESGPHETLQSVADKIGVTRQTVWRWLNLSPDFRQLYNALLSLMIESAKGKTLSSLIKGANTQWAGQPAMQKQFWTLAGMVTDRIGLEVSGPAGQPVQVEHKLDADKLPMVVKKLIYHVAKGGVLSIDLERRLNDELDSRLMAMDGEGVIDV